MTDYRTTSLSLHDLNDLALRADRALCRRPAEPAIVPVDVARTLFGDPETCRRADRAAAGGRRTVEVPADRLRRRVNEIVRGRRGLTPDTAIRLAHVFGGDPAFWLNLQAAWDLHVALQQQKPQGQRD